MACARRTVMILYNGQHMQKYRSKAMVVMSSVEYSTWAERKPYALHRSSFRMPGCGKNEASVSESVSLSR